METSGRRALLFQPRGVPPVGTAISLALQHLSGRTTSTEVTS